MATTLKNGFWAFFLLISVFGLQVVRGQEPAPITGNASVEALIHSGDLPPLWQTALQEGRWHNTGGSQLLSTAYAGMEWPVGDDLSLTGQAEIDHSTGLDKTYLHTGWLGIQWKSFSLKGGKHAFAPIFREPNMGTGSYLFGYNHRPFTRVTLELKNYTPVPLTEGRIEVRGGISQGWLTDQPVRGDVLLHEKYGYIRWDGGQWKPYAGLNHSAQFGGERSGEDIPVDFWATFRAGGSSRIGGGEETNAAGGHMGLFDFGTYFESDGHGTFHLYYQIPFSDGSGMHFWHENTDLVLGVDWKPKKTGWLNRVTLEWIKTTYQSGNGMPDPIVDGEMIFPDQVDDRNAFVSEHFGIDYDRTLSLETFKGILEDEVNQGNDFGGRDGYMNNGMYPDSWIRHGHVMGSPLNLTRQQLLAAHPGMSFERRESIKNDRFRGVHLGLEGKILPRLKWTSRLTYTKNYGTYYEQYPGRYTWNEVADYWFKGGRNQWYTMLGFSWNPARYKGWEFWSRVAFDGGEIYQSTGFQLGVKYCLSKVVNINKRN